MDGDVFKLSCGYLCFQAQYLSETMRRKKKLDAFKLFSIALAVTLSIVVIADTAQITSLRDQISGQQFLANPGRLPSKEPTLTACTCDIPTEAGYYPNSEKFNNYISIRDIFYFFRGEKVFVVREQNNVQTEVINTYIYSYDIYGACQSSSGQHLDEIGNYYQFTHLYDEKNDVLYLMGGYETSGSPTPNHDMFKLDFKIPFGQNRITQYNDFTKTVLPEGFVHERSFFDTNNGFGYINPWSLSLGKPSDEFYRFDPKGPSINKVQGVKLPIKGHGNGVWNPDLGAYFIFGLNYFGFDVVDNVIYFSPSTGQIGQLKEYVVYEDRIETLNGIYYPKNGDIYLFGFDIQPPNIYTFNPTDGIRRTGHNSKMAIYKSMLVYDEKNDLIINTNFEFGNTRVQDIFSFFKPGNDYPTCTCSSCSDCNEKLDDPACATVKLEKSISSNGDCIEFPWTSKYKVFDCDSKSITGTGSGEGISTYPFNTVRNCVIDNFETGIYTSYDRNKLIDNELKNNDMGVYIHASSHNTIDGCKFNNNQKGIEIYYFSTMNDDNKILNSDFTQNKYGVLLQRNAPGTIIEGCTFFGDEVSIAINYDSDNVIIKNNTFTDISDDAINSYSNYLTVESNIFNNIGTYSGTAIESKGNYSIIKDNIVNKAGSGIKVYTTGLFILDPVISGNVVYDVGSKGIYIKKTKNALLTDNIACYSGSLDVDNQGTGTSGSGNKCDTSSGWTCQFTC
jgi:parallel beta-helix repeat protein